VFNHFKHGDVPVCRTRKALKRSISGSGSQRDGGMTAAPLITKADIGPYAEKNCNERPR
jgi:hypothetical protein